MNGIEYIENSIKEFLDFGKNPKLVCICNNPKPGEFDRMYWAKCINCKGQISMLRWVDVGHKP